MKVYMLNLPAICMVGIIKRLARWILSNELMDEYSRGWKAGVNQQLYEPDSAAHGVISHSMYWRGEE